jgi:Transposase DDE domain
MAAFDLALAHVREGADDFLLPQRINQLARRQEISFRNTALTPGNTLRLFVQQVAHGNVACSAMRHLAGEEFSDSAWCQARARLPLELIQEAHRSMLEVAKRELEDRRQAGAGDGRWRGHRVFSADGTSDSMPDTPELRAHYGVSCECREGLGFPTSHLLMLMDHHSGLVIDCADGPLSTSDVSQTPPMHRHLEEGDILLADVAFSGWGHLALILRARLHALMPVHHRRIVDFAADRPHAHPRKGKARNRAGKPRSRVIKTLGADDQLVEYFKPKEKPAWMSDQVWSTLPESITVREIRRSVQRPGFRPITVTIVTTLLDAEAYPAEELVELRLTRWMIETNFRHLKTTLGMDVLKCKTLAGIRKERWIFIIV